MSADQKVKIGKVVSDKMSKTRVVEVTSSKRHDLYEKILRKKKHYYAHDEGNASRVGDQVEIRETRPLSRLKRWQVFRVIGKAGG